MNTTRTNMNSTWKNNKWDESETHTKWKVHEQIWQKREREYLPLFRKINVMNEQMNTTRTNMSKVRKQMNNTRKNLSKVRNTIH